MTDLGVLLMLCVLGFLFIVLPRLYRDLIRRREWEGEDEMPRSGKAKWALGGLVLAVGVASFMYRLLVLHKLEQTSALFIGLPVVLAILVILFVQPKSATGMLCMATTIALLVSGIFLGEGFICILMAAPLFYAVAVVIGIVIDFTRMKGRSQGTMTCLLVVGFLPMILEGVRPQLSFPREQTVVRESVVPRSGAEVEENLAGPPQFVDRLPGYLRMGFPRPTSAEGRGLKPGDVRLVHFAGGEGKPGDLVLRVSEANENHIVFKMDSDTSHVAHWLHWESAEVEMGTARGWDTSAVDVALPPPARSGVVLRSVGTLCGWTGGRVPDRERGRSAEVTSAAVDPVLMVRAGALYVPMSVAAGLWSWRRPSRSTCAGILLASLWNFEVLYLTGVTAPLIGWWKIHATGAMFAGMPLEFLIGWVVLWGVVPSLAFPTTSPLLVVTIFLGFDLALMPRMAPVLELGSSWLVGEGFALSFALLPSIFFARATRDRSHLARRALMQVAVFSGLIVVMVPAVIFAHAGGDLWRAWSRPAWVNGLLLQVLAPFAVLGLSAVQEFAARGGGTPLPYDPPVRLVTSGPYAYVANPMQISAMLLLFGWGWFLGSWWIVAAGVMAHIYSVGLAAWNERSDVEGRFGDDWREYRRHVRNWAPRWRPWHPSIDDTKAASAKLYVAETCGPCSEVKAWFGNRQTTGLEVVPAESYPGGELVRVAYVAGDGVAPEYGVAALARAVEHIHLGWALVGFAARLPVVSQFLQLLADASGGGSRRIGIELGKDHARSSKLRCADQTGISAN